MSAPTPRNRFPQGSRIPQDKIRDAIKRRESELSFVPRVIAEVSEDRLTGNYVAIQSLNPSQTVIPMIKANAYGHGIEWAARALFRLPMLEGLGVATLEEGAQVREALGPAGRRVPIIVFSGCVAWSEEKARFCEAHGLRPVIASEEDFAKFLKGGWAQRLPYELKFNTGMNRLGMDMDSLGKLRKTLLRLPPEKRPLGVLSHLAMADNPTAKNTLQQFERFRELVSELKPLLPTARFHIANSSAIWNSKHYGLRDLTDVVRPGIALYGVPPWAGAPAKGIRQVMSLRTSVIQIHELRAGETVGYGATYRVAGKAGTRQRVAVLPVGYGDGLHRVFSNRGTVRVGGRSEKFLGIISMDMSAVSCANSTKVGASVELLGDDLPIWTQAREAETIPYELLTSVSPRVQRVYA